MQKDRKDELRNPEMRTYFEYKISKGKTKIQALINIMRRLVSFQTRAAFCHLILSSLCVTIMLSVPPITVLTA